MVSTEHIRFIVGVIGNITSFYLFGSPIPTFWRIIKNRSVEEFKPDPYIASVINCMFWIFYGLPIVHPNSLLVITINSIGLGLELIYLTVFCIFSKSKKQRMKIFGWLCLEVLGLAIVATITLLVFHTYKWRSNFVGIFCVVFGVLMYSSPLTVMTQVIKTKSVEYMPFMLSLASFLNGVIWLTYALLELDLYILIGNGLGALAGAVQLILYFCYYKSTPRGGDNVKPSEVQLQSAV